MARPVAPATTLSLGELSLRRWEVRDAEELSRAVTASVVHLRPWMPWARDEPIGLRARQAFIERCQDEWESGDAYVYGLFCGDSVVGGVGLHRRIGPGGLEIGYWVHVDHLCRGYATRAAAALRDAALALPEVSFVEIHHDQANVVSARVPAKLGFAKVGERPDTVVAPGECGINWIWRYPNHTDVGPTTSSTRTAGTRTTNPVSLHSA
jgi:ribosomal-protein-serine acetyltransferase